MAIIPLSEEAIARQKKVNMALDDLIKMSKRNLGKKKQRVAVNKTHSNFYGNQDRLLKVRQYMDSRSTLRQGVLAQKRTTFQGNNFPLADETAQKSAVTTFRTRPINQKKARNWNESRPGGPIRCPGNASTGGENALKPRQQQKQQQQKQRQKQQQQQQRQRQKQQQQPQQKRQQHQQQWRHQHPVSREELIHNQKFRTLDSLFAKLKEQRSKASTHMNNRPNARNQPRQAFLRG